MNRFVNTYNEIVGFHRYPTAPQFCLYLAAKHRHVFVIRASFRVEHNNRQLEINQQQNEIKTYLLDKYGEPCKFGDMSCEDIAEELLTRFHASRVQVLEDGYGGATITE